MELQIVLACLARRVVELLNFEISEISMMLN